TYTFPRGAVKEFAMFNRFLAVQLPGGKIEIRRGASVRRLRLPPGGRLRDFSEGILLYTKGRQIRLLRIRDGKDVLARTGDQAVLEPNGLTYTQGRRVYSVAWFVLSGLFR